MVKSNNKFFSSPLSSYVHCFLDGGKISKVTDLVSLEENSFAYVIGCYYGVIGGVHGYFDHTMKADPRCFFIF
jgi:hypothetical protein